MKQSERPVWKKSMLEKLDYGSITNWLYEIGENGDMYGYDGGDDGYYQEYKELFDDLSDGAYVLLEALEESNARDNWDDMTVALLGQTQKVLGFNAAEEDYFGMLNREEDWAVEEAKKRLERMTKADLIKNFRMVLVTLVSFFDLKAAHDCLTSIVQELDEKGALLAQKNEKINQIYGDLTGKNGKQFDDLIANLPQRMWVE